MTGRRLETGKAALALLSAAGLAAALLFASACGRRDPVPQTRHPLHRRRDVGPDGGRGQPLPHRPGRRAGLAQAPGQGFRRHLGRQRLQRRRETGRPSALLPVLVHAAARLRRQKVRGPAAGRARRRRAFSDRSGHGFGLGGDRHGHGIQDGFRQHLLAPGRSSRRRAEDDRRGYPGRVGGGDRCRQHRPVRPRDAGRLRQPQSEPERLLHRAQRL